MDDLSFSAMLKMQYSLWEENKALWSPLEPEYARNSLLWMMAEVGEVIDIIKKCGESRIIEDKNIKKAFVEELCDVLMYFNDTLLRYDISAEEIAAAYTDKHNKNMSRSFAAEEKAFAENLRQ
jgi:NTP pyrophosphatase (non-canonical NTP hydrolase)